nr:unnamed protein product [Digitaria exilis]
MMRSVTSLLSRNDPLASSDDIHRRPHRASCSAAAGLKDVADDGAAAKRRCLRIRLLAAAIREVCAGCEAAAAEVVAAAERWGRRERAVGFRPYARMGLFIVGPPLERESWRTIHPGSIDRLIGLDGELRLARPAVAIPLCEPLALRFFRSLHSGDTTHRRARTACTTSSPARKLPWRGDTISIRPSSSSKEGSLARSLVAACACRPLHLSINRVLAESTGKQKLFPLTPPQRIFHPYPSRNRKVSHRERSIRPPRVDPYPCVVFRPSSSF